MTPRNEKKDSATPVSKRTEKNFKHHVDTNTPTGKNLPDQVGSPGSDDDELHYKTSDGLPRHSVTS